MTELSTNHRVLNKKLRVDAIIASLKEAGAKEDTLEKEVWI